MAKAGMGRPSGGDQGKTNGNEKINHSKNDLPPIPEIQGKAKHGHEKAGRIN